MQNITKKDFVVIGGGIGGYSAAIRAAQLGKKVTIINEGKLGGTCLNIGCIPTKALLHSANLYEELKKSSEHGINIEGNISFNWKKIMEHKSQVVDSLVNGVYKLIASNKIEHIEGRASFIDSKTLVIDKEEKISANNIIIATGSVPSIPPIEGSDLEGVMDSTAALSMKTLPKNIVIIGGGVIGMEFAQVFSSLGVDTTIIEMLEEIGGPMDKDIAYLATMNFEERGVKIKTNSLVKNIQNTSSGLKVNYQLDGKSEFIEAEKVLISTGRIPYTKNLNADGIGIKFEKQRILVDDKMRTNIPGIYAVGDVCSKVMLAHVAEEQGIVAAEEIAGFHPKSFDYSKIPSCVYTKPEIAFIGINEKEAKESGKKYRTGIFSLAGNGKAIIEGQVQNTVIKLIFDDIYDELLGAHIYGPSATELIAEMSLAVKLEATAEEIIETIHPHPTVSEGIKEAALDSFNRAIHSLKK